MKLKFLLSALSFVAVLQTTTAQNVGINANGTTPDPSAMLDVSATNKGLLIPRIALTSTTDNTTIPNPAAGLLIYNTNAAIGNGVGYYSNTTNSISPSWVKLVTSNGKAWETAGNTGTTAGTDFIGTTDAQDVVLKRNGGEIARITSSGIGISSSSPTVSLGSGGYLHFGQAGNITSTSGLDINIDNDNTSTNSNFRIQKDGGTTLMQVQENGRVGIGTATPAEILEVAGNVQFSGALMPAATAGTLGQILTSSGANTAPTWGTKYESCTKSIYWSTNLTGSFAYGASLTSAYHAVNTGPGGWSFPTGTAAVLVPSSSTAVFSRYVTGSGINSISFSAAATLTNFNVYGGFSVANNASTVLNDTYNILIVKYSLGNSANGTVVSNAGTTAVTGTLLGSSGNITNTATTNDYKFNITVPSVSVVAGDVIAIWVDYCNNSTSTSTTAKSFFLSGTVSYQKTVQ